MPSFDIITFDCYGTLIDWESGIVRAFQSEASLQGQALSPREIVATYMEEEPGVEAEGYRPYREVLVETSRRVAGRLGLRIAPERADFLPKSLPEWLPFPDTNAALERLAGRFQVGILSNIDDDLFALTRRHFTIAFEPLITAAQVKSYKPGPAHFREAIARTKGKRLLHAASSYFHDVLPAQKLNIPVAWVNRTGERVPEGGLQPTMEVPNLSSLADFLAV